MNLPPALQPWSAYLGDFVPDLAIALGPLLRRLELAIGPLGAAPVPGSMEPDGFDGLAIRGSYERLLPTEWLLADEWPEEFIRRAAMGEHSFLRLAHRDPAISRATTVLLDAGPSQLGAPRLAQLALLIVLARRSEAAGRRFWWGTLQDSSTHLSESVTQEGILRFLAARTAHEVEGVDRARWLDRFDRSAGSELWVVGSDRIRRMFSPERPGSVVIAEDADRALRVSMRHGMRNREVTLPLPPNDACTRLIRCPFPAEVSPRVRVQAPFAPTSNLIWSRGGLKLIARTEEQTVAIFALAKSPQSQAGRPRLYRQPMSRRIVAAGLVRKLLVMVSASGPRALMQVETLRGKTGGHREWEGTFPDCEEGRAPAEDRTLGCCYAFPPFGPQPPRILVQVGRALFVLEQSGVGTHTVQGTIRLEERGVLGIWPMNEGLAYARKHVLFTIDRQGTKRHFPLPASGSRVLVGSCDFMNNGEPGLYAVETAPGQWRRRFGGRDADFSEPETGRVVGLVGSHRPHLSGAFLLLRDDERTLTLRSEHGDTSIPRASAEIAEASSDPFSPVVAYTTVTGELVVYSLLQSTVLYRYRPEDR